MAMTILALWFLSAPKEEICSLALGAYYLPSLLGIWCGWHWVWAGDLGVTGQHAAVEPPSLLLVLMCWPFRPAQLMLEIELAVRFLESVIFLKKEKQPTSCLTAMSYHYAWSLKRGIWDFQGTVFRGWCALKGRDGEKVLLSNYLLTFTDIICSVVYFTYASLFNPYSYPCQRKIAPNGLNG